MAKKTKAAPAEELPGQTAPTAEAAPTTSPGEAEPVAPAPAPEANGNGGAARRPAASWRYPAAAGVTVEVALWPHKITLQSGEEIEVFNATVTRSYKDQ